MADAPEKKSLLEPNLALWDRIARAAIASVIVVAWYEGWLPADMAIAALVLAGALMVNGIMGKCGIYALMGFSTCKVKPHKAKHSKK